MMSEPQSLMPQRAQTSASRVDANAMTRELDMHGCYVARTLLSAIECTEAKALYSTEESFRSRVVMQRHGYGRGEYKYFDYPLPPLAQRLRTQFYPLLAGIANRWNEVLGQEVRYPPEHAEYLARCHAAGQTRATPLLLRYASGDYNCLHQDLYGEHVFPLQMAILLSAPEDDFSGGEFVLTEQRPRRQSRVEVVQLSHGDAVIFPVHHRPVQGARGWSRVTMRHGVSRLHSGERYTLGIIFHDAR